jgi:hypothetical protein
MPPAGDAQNSHSQAGGIDIKADSRPHAGNERMRDDGAPSPFRVSARGCPVLVPAIVGALASPAPALAQNRYGIAEQYGTFQGAEAKLYSACLSVPSAPPDFVNNDLWLSRGGDWVEAGIIQGWFLANPQGGAHTAATPRFFWGDNTSQGFYSHLGPQATLGVDHVTRIHQDLSGTGKWNVTVGGYTGTSRNTFLSAAVIQTGTETTTVAARAYSTQAGLAYWNNSGSRRGDWYSPTYGNAVLRTVPEAPPHVSWKSRNTSLVDYVQGC